MLLERRLANNGVFRLLGVDLSRAKLEEAKMRMARTIEENPVLRKSSREGRLSVEYKLAKLGDSSPPVDDDGNVLLDWDGTVIKNFSDINLQEFIGQACPDTFFSFYFFSIWSTEREDALRSIAEKSRKRGPNVSPTYFISGEEEDVKTASFEEIKEFAEAVRFMKKTNEVDLDRLYNYYLPAHGHFYRMGDIGSIRIDSLPEEKHELAYAFLEFRGGTNPALKAVQAIR
jgi:hypothetical protein